MSDITPRLSLPLMQGAQAQKHVTHNEALEQLDVAVQLTLETFQRSAPPSDPQEGEAWGVPAGATQAWAGKDGRIASWRGGGWLFTTPDIGWIAWMRSPGDLRVWAGNSWETLPLPPLNLDNVDHIGVNATADSATRLAVASDGILLTHAGSGHRATLNKATSTDTASVVYQTNYAAHAEVGLAGDDNFSIKVTENGQDWITALRIKGSDGKVTLHNVLRIKPGSAPANPTKGDIYFDSADTMLRCHNGTQWKDLF